jgi:hypothetical protein
MWRILYADDVYLFQRRVQSILESAFPKESFSLHFTDRAFIGDNSADVLISRNHYHLVLADCNFQDTREETDQIVNDKLYPVNLLGEALIEKHKSAALPLHFVFLTAYRDSKMTVDIAFNRLSTDSKVAVLSKGLLDDEDGGKYFKKVLADVFRKCARALVSRISDQDKLQLLHFVSSRSADPGLHLKIGDEDWKLSDLCLGWNHGDTSINLNEVVRDLFLPDLTLASSACFGTLGIKQVTHSGNDYFRAHSAAGLSLQIASQFDQLDLSIEWAKSIAGAEVFGQTDFEQDYNTFKTICLNSRYLKHYDPTGFDRDAERYRDNHFRYGSAWSTYNSSGERNRKTLTILGEEPRNFLGLRENYVFEVNIPIHLIFKNPLEKQLGKSKREFMLWADRESGLRWPDKLPDRTNEIWCCRNYIIMRQEDPFQEERLLGHDVPDVIRCLSSAHFWLFGRYHILTRNQGEWSVYDCTNEQHRTKCTVGAIGEVLGKAITCDSTYQTYHVFSFLSWRQ